MYTAKLSIKKSVQLNRFDEEQNAIDVLCYLLGAYKHNGQIVDGIYPIFDDGDYHSMLVNIFNHDSLDKKFNDDYTEQWLSYLKDDEFLSQIISIDVESDPISTPEQESAFILTTQSYHTESPIKGFDSLNPIPIHYLPKTYEPCNNYQNILDWQRDYQSCDGLQMGCRVGEKWALAQMGDLNSELTQQGLEICQILTEKMGKPVYYHLFKYYITDDEENSKCPKCGGEWALETPIYNPYGKPLHDQYDFKCDSCCLLSNLGFQYDE